MGSSGAARGTVVHWDDELGGVLEAPDLPGPCWVPADVVEGGTVRTGQVADVDWTEPGAEGFPCRATRAVGRDDLQATPGG